jgi:hypothetical protein
VQLVPLKSIYQSIVLMIKIELRVFRHWVVSDYTERGVEAHEQWQHLDRMNATKQE